MAADGGSNTLAVDVENTLMEVDAAFEVSRWERHCIYRVPASFKDMNRKAYTPQVVSLGPFHHGDPNLLPMEEHKRRAWRHVLKRTGRPADEFTAAVEDVAEQLESAYMDLAVEWREGRKRFLDMMILDGCFILEVIRVNAAERVNDYAPNDPIFSSHRKLNTMHLIRRDMLMLENQLPLLLLQKLLAVQRSSYSADEFINRMVGKFLHPGLPVGTETGTGLGLHPLDVFRRGMIGSPHMFRVPMGGQQEYGLARSAVGLYEAGIRFKASSPAFLRNIRFRRGVLSLPPVVVDDSTEYLFRNTMAFELLHAGAGKYVTDYVFFMDCTVMSAQDAALLISKGIIENGVGSHEDVAKLFSSLATDVTLEPGGQIDVLLCQLSTYSRLPWEMWFSYLKENYLRSPWALLSVAVAFLLLLMAVLQTVYTMLQFYRDGKTPPSAPCPM